MDSKKKSKKKKKVVKPSQSSTTTTAAKSVTPTAALKDPFDPSRFMSDKSRPYGEMWSHVSPDDRVKHLFVVKLLFHGPFLFNQPTGLFDQAHKKAVAMTVLPDEGLWSMSLDRMKFTSIQKIGRLLDMILSAMGDDVTFFQFLVDPEPYGLTEDQTNSGLLEYLKSRETSDHVIQLLESDESTLQAHLTIIKLHLSQYIQSLSLSQPELTVTEFFASCSQREQQVAMVKERACNNMKADKMKAAIADFTRAIRVCPYWSELYYQRASCFKKTRERWPMVAESYRAVITDPTNPRVYLLLADAWLDMGREFENAKEAIATGCRLCKDTEQLNSRQREVDKLQREQEEENERNWHEMRARKGLDDDRLLMDFPLKRKEMLLQEELRHSSKMKGLSEEKSPADKNKSSIPYRSHKITLPDLGPIEFEQLDLPQLPSNVTLEKLLELAKHTECNYLDVNQYLVYPSDEDSDDSVRSWTSSETPHYRQSGGRVTSEGKSSDESEFEELSCPSLVSDDDDDDDVISKSHDQDNMVTAKPVDTPTEELYKSDAVDLHPSVSHDPITDDLTPSLPDESKRSCDPPVESHGLATAHNDRSHDQETGYDLLSSPDLMPLSFDMMMPTGSPELEAILPGLLDRDAMHPESPPDLDAIHTGSPDLDAMYSGSCDHVEITVAMSDPAAMLPVIPPPASHDLVTTPPDESSGSCDPFLTHFGVPVASHDPVTTSLESDLMKSSPDLPVKSHDSPLQSLDTAVESHDAITTPSISHDLVQSPPVMLDTLTTRNVMVPQETKLSPDTSLDENMATPPSSPSSTVNDVTDLDLD